MTDTNTATAPATYAAPVERPAVIGLVARAEAAEAAALARVAELQREVERLRTEQITDGNDPRLVDFWEKGGRIADAAGFCDEYDRIVDSVGGVVRERSWEVCMDVTVTLTLHQSVTARGESDAAEYAQGEVDQQMIADHIRLNGWDDITFDDWTATRD